MKRTCNGCRAFTFGCDLGYKTEVVKLSFNGHLDERKPLEECEKPKTYSELMHLIKIKLRKKQSQ